MALERVTSVRQTLAGKLKLARPPGRCLLQSIPVESTAREASDAESELFGSLPPLIRRLLTRQPASVCTAATANPLASNNPAERARQLQPDDVDYD